MGLADPDRVELSNLQRQILYETGDIGQFKTEAGAEALHDINPYVHVVTKHEEITQANITEYLQHYDIVADGTDRIQSRFLANDACQQHGKTLISGAVQGFNGYLTTIRPDGPGLRDVFPEEPSPDAIPDCKHNGVLGPAAGVIGSLMAVEVIKELLDIGESLSGRLLRYDALKSQFHESTVTKRG